MSKTPVDSARISFREKRSEFIGIIQPLEASGEFPEVLKAIKKEYHDASHICWAYRLREPEGLQELYSDAGEPAGSAGLPMLNALRSWKMENAVVFVVRHFGGTKLGKRGLMEAYGAAADSAVQAVKTRTYEHLESYILACPLEFYGELQHLLNETGGKIIRDSSTDHIDWQVLVPSKNVNTLIVRLRDISRGTAILKKEERT